jgi:hypothetical protein
MPISSGWISTAPGRIRTSPSRKNTGRITASLSRKDTATPPHDGTVIHEGKPRAQNDFSAIMREVFTISIQKSEDGHDRHPKTQIMVMITMRKVTGSSCSV